MTADFSLTDPAPMTGTRDLNVMPEQPGMDYGVRAVTAWLDVQLSALDIDDLHAACAAIEQRIEAGRLWFIEHGEKHPNAPKARRLRGSLTARHSSVMLQIRSATYACWVHCCELFACLCHVDRDAWIAENAPRRFSGTSPQSIWRAVRGRQPPPGAWPPDTSEHWIERRVSYLEHWNTDEMRELLYDRIASR